MQLIDISIGLSPDLPVWPGDPPLVLERTSSMEAGEAANVSRLEAGVHVGTHVDAPLHFIRNGKPVEELSLEILVGAARVVSLPETAVIDAASLREAAVPQGTERLLIKTRNGRLWSSEVESFQKDFVAVDESGAHWLVDRGVKLVGVDYLSVAPWDAPVPTHKVLLEAGVVIVEGLDLRGVEPGSYELYCLPLKLLGSDGAPARAVLRRIEEGGE